MPRPRRGTPTPAETRDLAVYLEEGAKRTFAAAVEWPGWARSGRDEPSALDALVAYAPRYALVAERAGMAFDPAALTARLEVVERLPGSATTDFGAPGAAPGADARPLDSDELERQVALLEAAWAAFDAAVAGADGRELRTGPRGGGRPLAKMTDHVLEAEEAYLVKLGRRRPRAATRMTAVRQAAIDTLTARARGTQIDDPSATRRLWAPRYHVRRSAWHALDHAWEIEDRLS